ncbi:MAG TPA: lysine--tRNA ligase [Acidimicrobiaceae bacterium]|nr:lysine--tRNA ligase [Acidimicrobiaceae bacterium]
MNPADGPADEPAPPADGPAPPAFKPDTTTAEIAARWADLPPGTETDHTVAVAGRLLLRRVQGKLAFGTLDDAAGRIQLFAPAAGTPNFDDFCDRNLGDWLGVSGVVMTTRRGELSVRVDDWRLLAPALHPFPDKWHGITDPDVRFRRRYVDLWVSPDARRVFEARSAIVSLTRRRLEELAFVEVETPVFHPTPGGALARPFETRHEALGIDLYLRVATELYLKRLVVGGFTRVFELGRVFRNEGLSTRHNPEFTMLELYEAYADYGDVMDLVEDLVAHLAREVVGDTTTTFGGRELDWTPPWPRRTMAELVSEHAGEPLSVRTGRDRLAAAAAAADVAVEASHGPGAILMSLYEKLVEPQLWGPVFVTDYPVEVSPLAQRRADEPLLTERFEAVAAGRELANGFTELTSPTEQRARFEEQAAARAAGDDEAMAVDEDYLRALEFGLPPTGGVGIGIDRLTMLLCDVDSIRDVLLFPTLRPEQT